jgi:hypothetical protein
MSLASLLTLPTNERGAWGFVFDHDQTHRSMFAALQPSGPTQSVGALPPILDPAPIRQTERRAGNWHFDHQAVHDQFNVAIFGVQTPQNMADATFAEKSSLTWWTFVNHHEHYLNNQIP